MQKPALSLSLSLDAEAPELSRSGWRSPGGGKFGALHMVCAGGEIHISGALSIDPLLRSKDHARIFRRPRQAASRPLFLSLFLFKLSRPLSVPLVGARRSL